MEIQETDISLSDDIKCIHNLSDVICHKDLIKYEKKDKGYYIKNDIMTIDTVAFCPDEYKCRLNGIIMCLGLVITSDKNTGKIVSHYVTGDDIYTIEKDKLNKISQLMKEKEWNWKNSKLKNI